jgi:transcriptional regulator with XRE-family HTH domain
MSDHETPVDWRQWLRAFGRQQRRVREFLGVSQQELARLAGVNEGAVNRLETARGVATPLLIVVKISLTLASELRRFDPTMVNADPCRAPEMPDPLSSAFRTEPYPAGRSDAEPGVEELVATYQSIPAPRRQEFLSIVSAAGEALGARKPAAHPARRAR